jgi:hypothetical protein
VPVVSCTECAGGVPGTTFGSCSLSGSNLVLNMINSQSSGTNYVLTSTNIALPRRQWKAIATNVFSASGNTVITLTNGVNRSVRQKFYIIQTP